MPITRPTPTKPQSSARLSAQELRKAIPREVFDTTLLRQVLSGYSRVEMKIHDLLKNGTLIQIKKGLYAFGPDYNRAPVCLESLANTLYGPSALSLEWALSYYEMIPERVETLTSITPNRDKEFQTPFALFSYRRLSSAKYAEGITQVWIDRDNPALIATPEKALCDTLMLRHKVDFETPMEACEFLIDNLRIDQGRLKKLDRPRLRQIVRTYKKSSLEQVLIALSEEK